MNKPYYEGRREKIITKRYGSYKLHIRYFADCNKAQVTMEDISSYRFPIMWSHTLTDEQANAALTIFQSVGYFDIPIMEGSV